MPPSSRRYRRGESVVVLPRDGSLRAADFALGVECDLSPRLLAVLGALHGWTSVAEVLKRVPGLGPRAARAALARLHACRLIERSDEPEHPRRTSMRRWDGWNPEAGLFHFGTKGGTPVPLDDVSRTVDGWLLIGDRPPPPVRPTPHRGRIALPPPRTAGALPRLLLARRSWRRFGPGTVTRKELASLLALTWGVQRWMQVRPGIPLALKTSPSGGACHSLEVYVVAEKVRGLTRGVYRYHPDTHALVRVRRGLPRGGVERCLRQPWFAGCAAGFFITSVWPRVQWKYRFPRAYRTVLIEAGHFAQTFCLVATWLGLAPFCTAAFDDAHTERLLGIDGVSEGLIYATGIGIRPAGVAWAPWPDSAPPPTVLSTASRRRDTA
jgi:SagB-type dehydrogenase family enzyme